MKRIMKELKKYKYTTIAVVLLVILLVVAILCYNAFFGGRGTPIYGNRLDGIEAVMPTSSEQDEVVKTVLEIPETTNANIFISGRTINIEVMVATGTVLDKAKTIPAVAISKLTAEQLAYFDVQVFVKCENEEEANYPMIAYKGKSVSEFSYTNSK